MVISDIVQNVIDPGFIKTDERQTYYRRNTPWKRGLKVALQLSTEKFMKILKNRPYTPKAF